MSEPLVTTETANTIPGTLREQAQHFVLSINEREKRGTYIFFCFCFLILSGTHVSESKKQECKTATKDVVFLLDTSGSVGAVAFEEVLNFTKAIVSTFRIGPQNTLVGIETFASIVHHQFALDVNKNMATLLTAIDSIPYQSGGTNIVAGLEYVIKNSFKAGGRRNADKILILVTDGQTYSPNATAMQVKSLRKTNIKVFCIGVGLYVDPKELQHIASGANHTLLIKDYDSLSNTIRKLHAAICKVSRNRKAPVYLRDFIHGFEYLEVAILTLVTVIAIGAFGCCCRFCVLFAKRREREEEEKPKRQQPCKRPKDWPSY
ncbi:collagen alpha-1(XXI) chain-like [Saccostrea echinata]|uniref:collagen alpha-1(XXI) chain-like n=1 Tax=Saccostrea echinata TaxID=191078 RepID=UPI002A82C5DD|nr:collagen alpha-1(XXI) chain-like [Saccostrea echinata]